MEQKELDLDYLADLSRLIVDDEDRSSMEAKLLEILNWVEVLSEVDTEGVEPVITSSFEGLPRREDEIFSGSEEVERVMINAPDRLQDFYVVPKVVE